MFLYQSSKIIVLEYFDIAVYFSNSAILSVLPTTTTASLSSKTWAGETLISIFSSRSIAITLSLNLFLISVSASFLPTYLLGIVISTISIFSLSEIKSRMLLPHEEEVLEEDLETNLKNRLIQYEKYKNMVNVFKELEEERKDFKTKSPTSILEYKENEVIHSSLEVDALKKAYEELLKRIEDEKPVQTKVTKKEISVDDQINKIREKFKQDRQINFFDLFEFKDKSYLVVTFLAILEMAKNKEIVIKQNSNFENILCEVVEWI